MGQPYIIAVMPTWNSYSETSECLKSLQSQSYHNFDIIVADNDSTDGSIERLKSEFPSVLFIQHDENRGFAGGVNKGIKRAIEKGAAYIWLMNNDIIVPNFVLGRLVDKMQSSKDIGMLTPKIMQYPNTNSPWFTQGIIHWRKGGYQHGEKIVDRSRKQDSLLYNDYIPFTCTLIRSGVFEDVGLLPERYFIYAEDADFSTRVRQHGYKLATLLDTDIYHKENSATGGPLTPFFTYYIGRNKMLFRHRFSDRT